MASSFAALLRGQGVGGEPLGSLVCCLHGNGARDACTPSPVTAEVMHVQPRGTP